MNDPARECLEAVRLGVQFLAEQGGDVEQLKLISVSNLIKGPDYAGPQVWMLIFKSRALIPADDQAAVGAGGEIFVNVDLSARMARLQGYGE